MVSNKRNFNTEGIILKRRNYGEADRIVVIYTKHLGKISCLAKGVRRPNSRKRASIELFSQIKTGGVLHSGINLITETVIVNSHPVLRNDLTRVNAAYQVCEILDRLTVDGSETVGVYPLTVECLNTIEKTSFNLLDQTVEVFTGSFW